MPIVIDSRLKLPPNLMRDLDRIDAVAGSILDMFRKINDELRDMGGNMANAKRQMQGIGSTGAGSSTTSGGRSQKPPKPPFAFDHDPQAGMRYYASAAAAGDPNAGRMFNRYKNMQSQRTRNQAGAQLYQKGGGNSLLSDVIARTRFGAGGRGMPLGVDIQRLISAGMGHLVPGLLGGIGGGGIGGGAAATAGMGGAEALTAGVSALNPVVLTLALSMAALTITVNRMNASADYFARVGQAQVAGGGTSNQAFQTALISKITGGNFTAAGQSMNAIAAARIGVSPLTGPFGDMDYNARGLKIFDAIRAQRSLDSARRLAAHAGDPSLANAYLLDPTTAEMVRRSSSRSDMASQQVGATYNAQKDLLGSNIERNYALGFLPFIKALTPLLETTNKTLEWLGDIMDKMEVALHIKDKEESKHIDKFGNSVSDFARAINQANGVFGGGARAGLSAGQGPKGYMPGFAEDNAGVLM